MDFKKLNIPGIKTDEQEQQYLASAPEGSLNYGLSKLPITIPFVHHGMIIS